MGRPLINMEEESSSSSEVTIDPNIYRFSGQRGSWRGPSTWDADTWVSQQPGYFTYPLGDQTDSSGIINIPR